MITSPKPFCILVTGGSGFIGSAFIEFVQSQGWLIRVLTRRPAFFNSFSPNIEAVHGDFSSTIDWSDLVCGVDVIVNIAAQLEPNSLIDSVNFTGPASLLNFARHAGVKRWVQLSSVGVYGPQKNGLVTENWPLSPINKYECSKASFDKHLISYCNSCDVDYCIIRPSNVYGPGMRNQSLSNLLSSIRNNTFCFIGPAGSSANYIHVDDVVSALSLSITHPNARNKVFNVSNYAPFEQLVFGLSSGFGLHYPKFRISIMLAYLLAFPSKFFSFWPLSQSRILAMSSLCRYSTNLIQSELGWVPTIHVRDGMRQYAQSLKT